MSDRKKILNGKQAVENGYANSPEDRAATWITHIESEVERLHQRWNEVNRQLAEIHDADSARKQMATTNESLRTRIMDLESYIDGRKARWDELNRELETYRETLAGMETAIEEKETQEQALGARIMDLERKLAKAQGRLDERDKAHQHLESSLRRQASMSDESIAGLQNEVTGTRELNRELTADNEKLKDRVRQLEAGMEERHERIESLKQELCEARHEIEMLRERVEAAEDAELHSAPARSDSELESAIGDLESETRRLEDENEAQLELITQLEADLEAKRQMLSVFDRSAERLTMLNQSLRRINDPAASLETHAPLIEEAELFGDEAAAKSPDCLNVGLPTAASGKTAVQHKFISLNDDKGIEYKISKCHMTIGRASSSDIQVRDTSVSRLHAHLVEHADGVFIEDSSSKNGVLVNDRRTKRARLQDGDIVCLGSRCSFRFVEEYVAAR